MSTFGLKQVSLPYVWNSAVALQPMKYQCGHCNHKVSSSLGYRASDSRSGNSYAVTHICSDCGLLTFFDKDDNQFPLSVSRESLKNIPDILARLLNEARISASLGAYTASVLCCRKMLMNIAVQEQAKEGESFKFYIEYLSTKGYIPPNGKGWVDYIRSKGNEANHEIALMNRDDSEKLLLFTEMLLKFIYEFPNMLPPEK